MPLRQDALCAVVPAWNEADRLGPLLAALSAEVDELVVVDGQSDDETVARATAGGARVLHAARGRARQLQAGVDGSAAPLLWFVHADSAVRPGSGRPSRRRRARPSGAACASRSTIQIPVCASPPGG